MCSRGFVQSSRIATAAGYKSYGNRGRCDCFPSPHIFSDVNTLKQITYVLIETDDVTVTACMSSYV